MIRHFPYRQPFEDARHRRSLNEIAGVEHDRRLRRFRPLLLDGRRHVGETAPAFRVRQKARMQISGVQDRDRANIVARTTACSHQQEQHKDKA